jgi:hypothetical protein
MNVWTEIQVNERACACSSVHGADARIPHVPILKARCNAIMPRRSKMGAVFLGYVNEGVPSTAYEAWAFSPDDGSDDDDESSGDKRLHVVDFGRSSGNSFTGKMLSDSSQSCVCRPSRGSRISTVEMINRASLRDVMRNTIHLAKMLSDCS